MKGKYINLITYNKNEKPIQTPVWFCEKDEKIYITTAQKRYKVKRIQNNSKVKLAPCNFLGKVKGSYIDGSAQVSPEKECNTIKELFKKKYFMAKWMLRKGRKGQNKPICIEITLEK